MLKRSRRDLSPPISGLDAWMIEVSATTVAQLCTCVNVAAGCGGTPPVSALRLCGSCAAQC